MNWKVRLLYLSPFLIFGLAVIVTAIPENLPIRPISLEKKSETSTDLTFPIQIILPKEDHGMIDVRQLNSDLRLIHEFNRLQRFEIALNETPDSSRNFNLTIIGHRWSPLYPPHRLPQAKAGFADWLYGVPHDVAPLVRGRLAATGLTWTSLFVTALPSMGSATPALDREQIIRQSTTTQVRRWLINSINQPAR